MSRIGNFLIVGWNALCVTFALVLLGSVGGCTDSTGTVEQAKRDEVGDKVVQDKMREFMLKKSGPVHKK